MRGLCELIYLHVVEVQRGSLGYERTRYDPGFCDLDESVPARRFLRHPTGRVYDIGWVNQTEHLVYVSINGSGLRLGIPLDRFVLVEPPQPLLTAKEREAWLARNYRA